ncbi:hypothetical protein [Staphylococcus equorum]|uniref:hypothetical protein n=1 Tax=Staphylococcus equorum TaxID=246432 RepID=UPI003CF98750
MSEIPIVTGRNQRTGEYQFYQTHAEGVVGLDEHINDVIKANEPLWKTIQISNNGLTLGKDEGYTNSYKIIGNQVFLRLNLKGVTNESNIQIPKNLTRFPQERMVNTDKSPIQITIQPSGNVYFNTTKYNEDWSSDNYVYQELFFFAD